MPIRSETRQAKLFWRYSSKEKYEAKMTFKNEYQVIICITKLIKHLNIKSQSHFFN